MKKQIFSFFLTLLLFICIIPLMATPASAAEFTLYTQRDLIDVTEYTVSSSMAAKLNEILDGHTNIYDDRACTVPVNTYLGTSPVKNNGDLMFVGEKYGEYLSSGTSCFIYANGVYYSLFGESTGSGTAGEHSEKLNLSGTGSRSGSYENFKAWGVRQGVGALIRASGHSMIVMDYDEESITILDGNSDGMGRVSMCRRTWENFRKFYYVSYIIQPTDSYYSELYGCGTCGEDAWWDVDGDTLTISGSGMVAHPGWSLYSSDIKHVVIGKEITGIADGVFLGCKNLENIRFEGNAPELYNISFLGITATAHYPVTGAGWLDTAHAPYGGNMTWVPYGMTEVTVTGQPQIQYSAQDETAEISVSAEGDGLSYTWYVKNDGEDLYLKASVTGPVYYATWGENAKDRMVVCVIQDQYGNTDTSQSVLLRADGTATILDEFHSIYIPQVVYC